MKRWICAKSEEGENLKIDAFIAEIIEVSKKHGLSISHEDAHGAFEIENYDEENSKWLLYANDRTSDA